MADLANLAITCTSSPSSAPAPDVYSIFGHLVTVKPSDIGTLIVTLAIGSVTVWIANWQRRIAKEKVISDLFDRRYKIYYSFVEHIQIVLICIDMKKFYASEMEVISSCEEARFLFGEKLHKRLVKIKDTLQDIRNERHFQDQMRSAALSDCGNSRELLERSFERGINLEKALRNELSGPLAADFMPFLKIEDFREQRS